MKAETWSEVKILWEHYPELYPIQVSLIQAFELLCNCFRQGGTLYLCGNGGSASDCEHIVGELMKEFQIKRPLTFKQIQEFDDAFSTEGVYVARQLQAALPAISLPSQVSISTAFINDVQAEFLYAQLIYGYGKKADVLWGLSTSGNSANIVNAMIAAKSKELQTLGLTGQTGGKLERYCDVCIKVPSKTTFLIQEYHLPVYHTLCRMLEKEFFS